MFDRYAVRRATYLQVGMSISDEKIMRSRRSALTVKNVVPPALVVAALSFELFEQAVLG